MKSFPLMPIIKKMKLIQVKIIPMRDQLSKKIKRCDQRKNSIKRKDFDKKDSKKEKKNK